MLTGRVGKGYRVRERDGRGCVGRKSFFCLGAMRARQAMFAGAMRARESWELEGWDHKIAFV